MRAKHKRNMSHRVFGTKPASHAVIFGGFSKEGETVESLPFFLGVFLRLVLQRRRPSKKHVMHHTQLWPAKSLQYRIAMNHMQYTVTRGVLALHPNTWPVLSTLTFAPRIMSHRTATRFEVPANRNPCNTQQLGAGAFGEEFYLERPRPVLYWSVNTPWHWAVGSFQAG